LRTIEPSKLAREQLADGEHLLWCGRPSAGRLMFDDSNWFYLLYFALALIRWLNRQYIVAGVWCLLGIANLTLRVFRHAARSKKTVYAVTNQRIFMIIADKPDSLVSFRNIDATKIRIENERSDGFGDLVFKRFERVLAYRNTRAYEVRLRGIPDVRNVEKLVREAFAQTPVK
jgi:hypothetical protein